MAFLKAWLMTEHNDVILLWLPAHMEISFKEAQTTKLRFIRKRKRIQK